jgi:hypothetical protein
MVLKTDIEAMVKQYLEEMEEPEDSTKKTETTFARVSVKTVEIPASQILQLIIGCLPDREIKSNS